MRSAAGYETDMKREEVMKAIVENVTKEIFVSHQLCFKRELPACNKR